MRLLVNSAIFISSIGKKNYLKTKTENFIIKPEIIDIPTSTNEAKLELNCIVPKNTNIAITLNEQVVKNFFAKTNKLKTFINLIEGKNKIQIIAKDNKLNIIRKSPIYTVEAIFEKPSLEISFPDDGYITYVDEITISGITESGNSVKINNKPIVVDADGKFNYSIKLSPNENLIVITATNQAGSSISVKRTIIYNQEEL